MPTKMFFNPFMICFHLSTLCSRKAHTVQPGAKLFRKCNRTSAKKKVTGCNSENAL